MTTTLPVTQINLPPGFIDLGLGNPQTARLPLDLLRQAAETHFARREPEFLQYGAEQGNGYFRQALAKFLNAGYGCAVEPESLFVTCGASSGLDLLCTLFTQLGDTIFVEEPTYFLALRIFADHGLRVVSIPTDEDGLLIAALEESLAKYRPKFLYIIPTFQNPTGRTFPLARRERLSTLSREHDFIIAADEVYHLLGYGPPPPKALAAFSGAGNVISLGSFSKILAPGLRLGWIQADAGTIERLATCGLLDSGGGMNPFTSAIVRGVLESGGLEKNIEELKSVYASRLAAMDAALRTYLPEAVYAVPQGGYFFWVRLPGVDTSVLQKQAEAFKVGFRSGVRFSSQDGLRDFIRLSFAFYEPEEIEQGILRLTRCILKTGTNCVFTATPVPGA